MRVGVVPTRSEGSRGQILPPRRTWLSWTVLSLQSVWKWGGLHYVSPSLGAGVEGPDLLLSVDVTVSPPPPFLGGTSGMWRFPGRSRAAAAGLHHSSRQRRILNPLSGAREPRGSSQLLYPLSHSEVTVLHKDLSCISPCHRLR